DLGALHRDALLGGERVRALRERSSAERRRAAGQETRLRLGEALLQILALRTQGVLRADEAHRALELLLSLCDRGGHRLAIVENRLDDADVDEREHRRDDQAEDDAPVALRVAVVPGERALPQRARVERERHFTTSAVSEKRSLSPWRVVGELNVT